MVHQAARSWPRETTLPWPPGVCRKSDVSGRSGFDWSGQSVRLKGSTVLLVMVYLTHGLAESGENLEKMWELPNLIRDRELPFICMGDWNMTPEEMQENTELVRLHWRCDQDYCAPSSTPTRLWTRDSWDYALVQDAGKLVGQFQVEISHCFGGHSLQHLAPHTMKIGCKPKTPHAKSVGKRRLGRELGHATRAVSVRPSGKRGQRYCSSLWLHGDQELQASM